MLWEGVSQKACLEEVEEWLIRESVIRSKGYSHTTFNQPRGNKTIEHRDFVRKLHFIHIRIYMAYNLYKHISFSI